MQKFREKQALLVVVFKVKAVYNSSKSQNIVLNLILICNFTSNKTKQYVSTPLIVILWLFLKMSHMEEEQAVFEQSL